MEREAPELIYSIKNDLENERIGSTLKSALKGKLLIIRSSNFYYQFLSIDQNTGRRKGKEAIFQAGKIHCLQVFGEEEDHFVVVCEIGVETRLKIFKISFPDLSFIQISECNLEKRKSNKTKFNVVVCPKSTMIALNIHEPSSKTGLTQEINLSIFRFQKKKLKKMKSLKKKIKGEIGEFCAMKFLNYYHSVLVLSALDYQEESKIFTFFYDCAKNHFFEKEELRDFSGVGKVTRFENYGQRRLRGGDNKARIFEICYSLGEEGFDDYGEE